MIEECAQSVLRHNKGLPNPSHYLHFKFHSFSFRNRLIQSKVLIIGIGGLGAEVCKNLVLAGVSVSIWDNQPVTTLDLNSQFFIGEEDIGKKVNCFDPSHNNKL